MNLLMSFWPSVFDSIVEGNKKIEYRRSFPRECGTVYMYVTKPVKAICGIMKVGERHNLDSWRELYVNDSLVINKINSLKPSYRYAIEIKEVQIIKPIPLDYLVENNIGFKAPQSYIILDKNEQLLNFIEGNTVLLDQKTENDFLCFDSRYIWDF
ncbi:MAG: ASCH domain-containing protein [Culicoidibacterales bacterium]